MKHADARAIVLEAWGGLPNAPTPTAPAVQAVQAIALGESGYGEGWKATSAMHGSKNWGAVQCCRPLADGTCPEGSAPHGDRGPTGAYVACFKLYPTHVAGARDLLRELFRRSAVRAALDGGDATRIAGAMYDSRYFTATKEEVGGSPSATRANAVARYGSAIEHNAAIIAKSLGEPVYVKRPGAVGVVVAACGVFAVGGAAWLAWRHRADLRRAVS